MLSINRNLVAVALAAALSAPMAFAGDPPTSKVSAKATDAVSQKTTVRETGRMKEPPVLTDSTVVEPKNPAIAIAPKDPPPGKGNWWADADIDGDGKLSVGEAKVNAGVDARFGNIDADADGFLTNDEYREFYASEKSQGEVHAQAHSAVVTRDVWTRLDANSDGKLSSSEVSTNTDISGSFPLMDSNGDGFVTQAEYSVYAKKNM